MRSAVWKFDVPLANWEEDGYFELDIPSDHKFLHADVQFGLPRLWFVVGINTPMTKLKFQIVPTGRVCGGDLLVRMHYGTFVLYEGSVVLHLFDASE